MTQSKPLILISNDDGIQAPGIHALASVAARYADVIVVAPDRGYSGQSHSFTVDAPLRVRDYDMKIDGVTAFMVGGSPVDCIKLGVHGLVPRRPQLILSGINHGSNTSSSVHYSGTLGACREAALLGIMGIGFSIDDEDVDADMTDACNVASKIIEWALSAPQKTGVFYGVNIPSGCKPLGIKPVRLAAGHWHEDYHMSRDPWNSRYYWLVGTFVDDAPGATDTDVYWLRKGYATICPCRLDVTDYDELNALASTSL